MIYIGITESGEAPTVRELPDEVTARYWKEQGPFRRVVTYDGMDPMFEGALQAMLDDYNSPDHAKRIIEFVDDKAAVEVAEVATV